MSHTNNINIQTAEKTSTTTNHGLQAVNYANLVGYLANIAVVFGSTAIAGLPDNGTQSRKYQTLVTPAGWAFSIWGIIFTTQLIWTVAQLVLPAFGSSSQVVVVVKGVGYSYLLACLAQCVWTVAFGLEKITLSMIAMICILIPLLRILKQMAAIREEGRGRNDDDNNYDCWWWWCLLQFPFEIHAAWIMAATLVNLNVVAVAQHASAIVQIILAMTSLVVLVLVGMYYSSKRRWVVPSVLTWASIAICAELSHPKDEIIATFGEDTIYGIKISAGSSAAMVVATMLFCKLMSPANRSINDDL